MRYYKTKKNIGLFGGTFDPVHFGHLRVSNRALSILKLDEVWWIVSLENPLRSNKSSDFEQRVSNAKKIVSNPKVHVSDLEKNLNTVFTIDILTYLKKNCPKTNFVWIMGADNLKSFHFWKEWKKIFSQVPIAIFDRPFYSLNVQKSRGLGFFKKNRLPVSKASSLKYSVPPRWIFLTGWANYISSTQVKTKQKSNAK